MRHRVIVSLNPGREGCGECSHQAEPDEFLRFGKEGAIIVAVDPSLGMSLAGEERATYAGVDG
jgi:hypothetical protein